MLTARAEALMDGGVMYTIEWPRGEPTLADAAGALQVPESDLDRSFGVVLIDPAKHAYTVLCRPGACASARPQQQQGASGPYSNPGIGAFGPPERR